MDKSSLISYMLKVYFSSSPLTKLKNNGLLTSKMTFSGIRLLFLCGFLVLAHPCQPMASVGETPEIKDIIVTTSDVDLLLFATVKNGFTREMLDDIKNGIPIVFTYQIGRASCRERV